MYHCRLYVDIVLLLTLMSRLQHGTNAQTQQIKRKESACADLRFIAQQFEGHGVGNLEGQEPEVKQPLVELEVYSLVLHPPRTRWTVTGRCARQVVASALPPTDVLHCTAVFKLAVSLQHP